MGKWGFNIHILTAIERRYAGVSSVEAEHASHSGAFARPVWSKETCNATWCHREGQIVNRFF
jgi:hypothetical protein